MTTNNDDINVANNVAQRNSQDEELMKKLFPHKEIIEGESVLVFPYIEEATPLKDVPQEVVSNMEKTIDHISQEGKKVSLTEQWKKGELEKGKKYWCKLTDEKTEICYLWLQTNRFTTLTGYQSTCLPDEYISEVLAEVPSYEEWQSLNELLDSMQDTNKVLAHKLNNIKVNGNYPDRISKLKSKIKSLTEELEPFTDPYFKGLTTKHISELAKKSIRLTKQSCDDNTTIQRLKELLCYCADVLEEMDDKDRDIEILLEEVNEVLK